MIDVQNEIQRLSGLRVGQLQEEYLRVCGEAPRSNNRVYLVKRIAWRLQAAESGGLSERARLRAAELARESDLRVRPSAEVHAAYGAATTSKARKGLPPAGSILTRQYRGRRIEVRVLEHGIEHEGVVYASLTAAAEAITGSKWNGRLFFGLTARGVTQ